MTKLFGNLVGNSVRIFLLIAFGLVFTFLVQSWSELTAPVELTLFTSVRYPLIAWVVLTFIFGYMVSVVFNLGIKRRLKKTIKQLEKENKEFLAELGKLRNLSLTDDIQSHRAIKPPDSKSEN